MNTQYFLLILIKCLVINEFVARSVAIAEVKRSIKKDKTYTRRVHQNGRSYMYLNYKETYGLRFDPKKIHKKRQNDPSTWEDMSISIPSESSPTEATVTSNGSDEMQMVSISSSTTTPTEGTTIVITTITSPSSGDVSVSTSSSTIDDNKMPSTESTKSNKQPILAFSTLRNRVNVSNRKNTTTTIQRPHVPSSLKETLQLIRKRIKQWLVFGTDSKASLINGQRFLNVFNVIKFDNSPCTSTQEGLSEMTGICYHDYQCTQMGGISIDECADGLGVCCVCMRKYLLIYLEMFFDAFVLYIYIILYQRFCVYEKSINILQLKRNADEQQTN